MRSLRHALLWPTILLAVLSGGALALVAWDLTAHTNRLEARLADARAASALVFELHRLTAESQRLVLSYAIARDDRLLVAVAANRAATERVGARIGRLAQTPRGERLWAQLDTALVERARAGDALVAALRQGDADATARGFARWDLGAATSRALLDDVAGYGMRRLDGAVADQQRSRLRSLLALLVVLASSALATLAYSAFVRRRVERPLAALGMAAARLGPSDEEVRLPGAERADEIGVLARALQGAASQLVQANARLAETVRARDDFLSIASHELKTPLTPLKLQLDVAVRRLGGAEPPRWLDTARRQVVRLESLVAQLLDVTRIRAGRLVLRRAETDLAAVVDGAVERLADKRPLRLELQRGVTGSWDADRLEQVVANLLSNALKYAPGSAVQVRVDGGDGNARLLVRDYGPGIPVAIRSRLFERFERAPDARNVGGLGLGLYIVRQLVEAHGGRVWAESEEGKGATFVVELPRDVGAASHSAARRDGAALAPPDARR